MNYIKSLLKKLIELADKVNKEEGYSKVRMYFGFFINYIIYGCSITEYFMYGFYKLNCYAKRKFITSRKQKKVAYWFNPKEKAEEFDNKYLFNKKFNSFIKREWMYTYKSNEKVLKQFLEKQGQVIIKPVNGACGEGIKKISYQDTLKDEKAYKNLIRGKFILEEIIQNHKEIRIINPQTLNTIRVMTLIKKDGRVKILKAFLRIGNGDSIVDNFHARGIACQIDIETGILVTKGKSIYQKDNLKHPKTQVVLMGRKMPLWKEAKEFSIKLAKENPKIRYIGWDIAITDNGIDLIEGNYVAGITAFQFIDGKGMYKELKREV